MFSFQSLDHFFASAAHDVKVGLTFISNHQTQINNVLGTATAVVSLTDPALAPIATQIDRAAEAALGEVLAVVSKLDEAAAQKGVSITLDAAAVAEFKNLLALIESLKPGATKPPASLTQAPAPATA